MIRKMLVPALVMAAASVTLPAAAQNRGDHPQDRGHDGGHQRDRSHRDWQSINQRQANLDRRIDQGLRNGQLSRREATRLRNEFSGLLRLEVGYCRGGLTQWERADLDRRFDRLSASIRYERRDRDNRRG